MKVAKWTEGSKGGGSPAPLPPPSSPSHCPLSPLQLLKKYVEGRGREEGGGRGGW